MNQKDYKTIAEICNKWTKEYKMLSCFEKLCNDLADYFERESKEFTDKFAYQNREAKERDTFNPKQFRELCGVN